MNLRESHELAKVDHDTFQAIKRSQKAKYQQINQYTCTYRYMFNITVHSVLYTCTTVQITDALKQLETILKRNNDN